MKKHLPFYFLLTIILFVFGTYRSVSQNYKFRHYSVEQGIPQPFIYTINQDKRGYLWIGTGEGLCRFDGKKFVTYNLNDSLANNFITCSYKDSRGDLWFGHNNGAVTFYNSTSFRVILPDSNIVSTINDISEDNNGNIWFVSQNNGLFRINREFEVKIFSEQFSDYLLHSLCFTINNDLFIGTNEGLLLFSVLQDTLEFVKQIENIPYTKIQCIIRKKNQGIYFAGTEDEGAFLLKPVRNNKNSYIVTKIDKDLKEQNLNVFDILEDSGSNLWLCTFGNGLYKLVYSPSSNNYSGSVHFTTDNGLCNNYIRNIFQDREGNIWCGTYGGGVSNLIDEFFTFYYNTEGKDNANVLSMYYENEIKWFGTNEGLLKMHLGKKRMGMFYGEDKGLPEDKVTSLYKDMNNIMWIGTDNNGLFMLDINTDKISKFHLSEDKLTNSVNSISGYGDHIWISTKNGLIRINSNDRNTTLFNTSNGLPHNYINSAFPDINGKMWVVTHSNSVCVIYKGVLNRISISDEQILNIISVAKDKHGNFWLATYGNGVFKYTKDTIINFTTINNLKSNYCYSIITDENNNVWVGHHMGLSKICQEGIKQYGQDDGITGDCNFNSVIKDNDGNIWFGTTNGIIRYDPKKDKKNLIPPSMNILSIQFSDQDFDIQDIISLPYDIYKLRIEFVGLSFLEPESVTYQYKLSGQDYDPGWSEPSTTNFALYNKIEDGEYTFSVRSCNIDGICNEEPLTFSIYIAPPFWKTWWFITGCSIMFLLSIYLFITIRERRQKKLRKMLKKELYERTKEVILQKEEIERKNIAITDSINYAQRIQAAILPSLKNLQRSFPDSFVFYLPRDIVSGDFYWFNMVANNNYVIACADATGHGVPGAFMSLIGTTLMKDICMRKEVNSPSDILITLDQEIKNTLKQDREYREADDGLDISVCEINLSDKRVKISSAMRPILIYTKKVFIHSKGNRFAIGGAYTKPKVFVNQEFQLDSGDIVYMFSDGYTDQFGGPDGKKLKISGLKNILQEICNKPMNQQYEEIVERYETWKKNYTQIDDVLFMAIRIP